MSSLVPAAAGSLCCHGREQPSWLCHPSELVALPAKWFGCSGKGQRLSKSGAVPDVLCLARQGEYSLPPVSPTPSMWPRWLHLPGHRRQVWGHFLAWRPRGAGWLVSILLYPLIPLILHPKWEWLLVVGPVWEGGHCTQALPGTLTACWHRQLHPRAWEGSLAVFQLTDIDVASSVGQQPCLRLPHPTCPVFCLYSWDRLRDTFRAWVSWPISDALSDEWDCALFSTLECEGSMVCHLCWTCWGEKRATHLLGTSSLQHLQPARGARAQPGWWATGREPSSLPCPSLCSPHMAGEDRGAVCGWESDIMEGLSSTGKKIGGQQPAELGSWRAAKEGVSLLTPWGKVSRGD